MLEQKIEQLTAAIERLTVKFDALAQAAIAESERNAPSLNVIVEEPTQPTNKTEAATPKVDGQEVTREKLHSLALEMVRGGKAHKDEIKKILADFKVKTIADLPDNALVIVHEKLVSLWA